MCIVLPYRPIFGARKIHRSFSLRKINRNGGFGGHGGESQLHAVVFAETGSFLQRAIGERGTQLHMDSTFTCDVKFLVGDIN